MASVKRLKFKKMRTNTGPCPVPQMLKPEGVPQRKTMRNMPLMSAPSSGSVQQMHPRDFMTLAASPATALSMERSMRNTGHAES